MSPLTQAERTEIEKLLKRARKNYDDPVIGVVQWWPRPATVSDSSLLMRAGEPLRKRIVILADSSVWIGVALRRERARLEAYFNTQVQIVQSFQDPVLVEWLNVAGPGAKFVLNIQETQE